MIFKHKNEVLVTTMPEWSDPSLKYLKIAKKLNSKGINQSMDASGYSTAQKHFLHPLLNKSKRRQFKKNMELHCKKFNEDLLIKKAQSAYPEESVHSNINLSLTKILDVDNVGKVDK